MFRVAPDIGTSNERRRREWLQKTLAVLPPGTRVLDAGAGELANKPFCAHLRYVSQDFGRYDGTGDQRGLQTGAWDTTRVDIESDITNIPEPDASFGAVLCSEVLEHLADPVGALREFARLLVPGGSLLLTAPFCSLTHFAPYHFSSGFNTYFYRHHLAILGFDIVQLEANGNFFEFLAQEIRRAPSVAARYANSRPTKLERFTLLLALRALGRWSAADKGSEELLCFGYHVHARKKIA